MMKQYISIIVFICTVYVFSNCSRNPIPFQRQITILTHKEADPTKNAEAREDSLEMAISLSQNAKFKNVVWADVETDAVKSLKNEDAADDPAIWVNPNDFNKSLILGTHKKSGLYVYDLNGKTKQFIPVGNINNVDLRNGFTLNNKPVTLVAGSNRSLNTISLFYIDNTLGIVSDTIANIKSNVDEVYGICMYRSPETKTHYIFVNGKGGMVEQWQIASDLNTIQTKLVRCFSVNTQPEGMVANDSTGILFLGVEEQGICKLSAEACDSAAITWLAHSSETNLMISYDIEGLSIYYGMERNLLIASVQGNFSYAIWNITDNIEPVFLTSFVIWETQIDGVEETDGIDITSIPLGNNYPLGLLVVQDGFNFDGDSLKNQNFKYVSAEHILPFID